MPDRYDIADLITLMQRLRDPEDGCPWDLRQNFKTIVPHTIEEAYEVAEAIEREDWPHVREELGDLLFQVVYYSQLGTEKDLFQWEDVVDQITRKLLRRHPHVFPDGTLQSRARPDQRLDETVVKQNWDRIKAEEKAERHLEYERLGLQAPAGNQDAPEFLQGVPANMPPLQRAYKLQQKAAKVGFDWPEVTPVIEKIQEELTELQAELASKQLDAERIEDELADVLFCCVNLSRFLEVDPDRALRRANAKFARRLARVESLLRQEGKAIEQCSLEEMDAKWDEAKGEGL